MWKGNDVIRGLSKSTEERRKVSLPLIQELNPALPEVEAQFLITQIN